MRPFPLAASLWWTPAARPGPTVTRSSGLRLRALRCFRGVRRLRFGLGVLNGLDHLVRLPHPGRRGALRGTGAVDARHQQAEFLDRHVRWPEPGEPALIHDRDP